MLVADDMSPTQGIETLAVSRDMAEVRQVAPVRDGIVGQVQIDKAQVFAQASRQQVCSCARDLLCGPKVSMQDAYPGLQHTHVHRAQKHFPAAQMITFPRTDSVRMVWLY